MQRNATGARSSSGWRGPALVAIAADFQARDYDVELAITLNLPLQAVEEIALKFHDLAATQACHVNVVSLWTPFVVMLLALHVHQVELVDQAMTLEQIDGAVDGDPVDLRINLAGFAQDLAGVEVLFGGLHDS